MPQTQSQASAQPDPGACSHSSERCASTRPTPLLHPVTAFVPGLPWSDSPTRTAHAWCSSDTRQFALRNCVYCVLFLAADVLEHPLRKTVPTPAHPVWILDDPPTINNKKGMRLRLLRPNAVACRNVAFLDGARPGWPCLRPNA